MVQRPTQPLLADAVPNRYELKYVITETQADAIREAIAPFCDRDPHAARMPGGQYTITSLYCDSPTLTFYNDKEEKSFTRFKLRVRTYGVLSDGPIFFEVKRKHGDIVAKSRVRVDRESWVDLVTHPRAEMGDFSITQLRWQARPVLLARYEREPFMSQIDDYARVTFDRNITYQRCRHWDLLGDVNDWKFTDTPQFTGGIRQALVLELKCTQAVPTWMLSIIRRFNLERSGYSKYCSGVKHLRAELSLSYMADRVQRYGVRQ